MSQFTWTIADNAHYWCIAPSIESQDHGDTLAVKPWLGKLRVVQNPGGTALYLHRFNQQTGQIDEDSNAMAIVHAAGRAVALDKRRVFIEESAAWQAYAEDLLRQTQLQLGDLADYVGEALQALERVKQLGKDNGEKEL